MLFNHPHSQGLDYSPRWARVTFRQMMYFGVHLGHTVFNSTPFCGGFLAGLRQGLFLIDLFKFTYQGRAGLFAVEGAVRRRAPVGFVHPQAAAPVLLSETARRCGEYFIHFPWIGGLLTNHRVVRRSLEKGSRRTDAGRSARQRRLGEANFRGDRGRFSRSTWPRVLFVSSARLGLKPCHEAQCLTLPALTITDTNSSADLASLAIPANEESTSALGFYTNLLSLFVLHRKFGFVNRFLFKSRRRAAKRRRLTATLAATLYASRDLGRRFSIRRLLTLAPKKAAPAVAVHPWAQTLVELQWGATPWRFCHRRTERGFKKAAMAKSVPGYHRMSVLKPRMQRGVVSSFGRDRFFQRILRVRGPYRSRPLWIYYQTFVTFFLMFAGRGVNLHGPAFRRLGRRPRRRYGRPADPSRRLGEWLPEAEDLFKPFAFRGKTRGRIQRLRLPWTDFSQGNFNLEIETYPRKHRFRRWQPPLSNIRHPRATLQISRYVARQFFASGFLLN